MLSLLLSSCCLAALLTTGSTRRVLKAGNSSHVDVDLEPHARRRLTESQTVPQSPEDHLVSNLPGLTSSAGLVHYAGHLSVDAGKGSNLFYWLFEKPTSPLTAPLVIWMNGGASHLLLLPVSLISLAFSPSNTISRSLLPPPPRSRVQ